ncbi:MAG: NrfD/PsrC family molybdoenzyme membrane anchor subunit [Acidimicrobiales bacterium]
MTGAVTRQGVQGERPGREATTGVVFGRKDTSKKRDAQRPMVPPARFESYYGKPVIKKPVWASTDIASYLFLGGLAGGSSVLGAGAHFTGRKSLARGAKLSAAGAGAISLVALVHDLGRPARFLNMLRVFKPTSPMSIGSWLLSGYVPAAVVAAATEATGLAPGIGTAATAGAAVLGPAVAAYTAALISDTAVPAWHDGHREMPFVFVSSAASAAGGAGLVTSVLADNGPARRLAIAGGIVELAAMTALEQRMHPEVSKAYRSGRAKWLMSASKGLTALGTIGALVGGRRHRAAAASAGTALLVGSACTRLGIFFAGQQSALDPAATVIPQRERLSAAH